MNDFKFKDAPIPDWMKKLRVPVDPPEIIRVAGGKREEALPAMAAEKSQQFVEAQSPEQFIVDFIQKLKVASGGKPGMEFWFLQDGSA